MACGPWAFLAKKGDLTDPCAKSHRRQIGLLAMDRWISNWLRHLQWWGTTIADAAELVTVLCTAAGIPGTLVLPGRLHQPLDFGLVRRWAGSLEPGACLAFLECRSMLNL
jgi:hypothetical protein